MKKIMKDNSEYRTKRQWFFIVLICLLVMVFLTTFLMKRYRQKTERVFSELMEETLLSAHSEALSEIEAFCDDQGETADLEKAWEMIKQDKNRVFHYLCDSKGVILAGDMKIFDIEYTVDTELRSIRIKTKILRK